MVYWQVYSGVLLFSSRDLRWRLKWSFVGVGSLKFRLILVTMLLCECLTQENRNLAEVIPPCKNNFFFFFRSQIRHTKPPRVSLLYMLVFPSLVIFPHPSTNIFFCGCFFVKKKRFLLNFFPPAKKIFFSLKGPKPPAPPPPPAISYMGLDVPFQLVPQILLSIST